MVDPQKQEKDELDDWFDDEEEGNQDPSASAAEEDEGESSPPEDLEATDPDQQEAQQTDGQAPLEEAGTDAQSATPEDNPYAWIESLDPEVRKQAEALINRDRSNSGRVAALQSRLDQLSAAQQAHAQASQRGRSPEQAAASLENKEDLNDEDVAGFMEEFPSVAKNVNKMIEQRLAKEREEILGQVRPLKEEALQQKIMHEREQLRQHASQIFNTAETGVQLEDILESEAWKGWLGSQPKGYQEFAGRATAAEDARKVLEDFARYSEEVIYNQWVQEQQAADQAAGQEDSSQADETARRRQQALGTNTPGSRSAETTSGGGAGDYESYFNEAVESG